MENGVDGYHPNFVHQAFFESRPEPGRKVMHSSPRIPTCESKDLGNGHSILDMSPKRTAGTAPQLRTSCAVRFRGVEQRRLHDESASARYGEDRTAEILVGVECEHCGIPKPADYRGSVPQHDVRSAPTRTDVHLLPTTLKGVPNEIDTRKAACA